MLYTVVEVPAENYRDSAMSILRGSSDFCKVEDAMKLHPSKAHSFRNSVRYADSWYIRCNLSEI